jgi:hypothetical protein
MITVYKHNFKYYDVAENRYGEIETKSSKYYKDGRRVSQRKKTYDEVKKLSYFTYKQEVSELFRLVSNDLLGIGEALFYEPFNV